MDHDHNDDDTGGSSKMRLVFFAFLAVAGFFLVTEHRAHLFGILPFLLLLACPLMHIFGHHGHGHHRHADTGRGKSPESGPPATPRNP